MYVAHHFKPQSAESIVAFVKKYGFAVLVSQNDNRPIATHLPLVMETNPEGVNVLRGHISRGNRQWRSIEGQTVMCIFSEPHAYISSSWYSEINVPTWNYIAVHIYGKARIIEGDELYTSLKNMVDHYEASRENAFRIEDMPKESLRRQMRGITGLEISVDEIEATFKLSQNRSDKDHANIIVKLQEQEDPLAQEIAAQMKLFRS